MKCSRRFHLTTRRLSFLWNSWNSVFWPIAFALGLAVLLASSLMMGTGSVAQAQVSPGAGWPPGFSVTTLVDGLDTPTDMAFLPSGEIW